MKKDKRFKVQNVLLLNKLFKLVSLTKNSIIQVQTFGTLLQKKLLLLQAQQQNYKGNTFLIEYSKIYENFKLNIKVFLDKFKDLYDDK